VRRCGGFTLIEVLVALAIVAIGMAAVLGTLGSSADTASYLRDKTFAQWIALNQLAATRLQTQPPTNGSSEGELDYAGRHWRWHQEVSDGGFPGILRIDVTVQLADTPEGTKAPWIGSVTGAIGNAVAPPQLMSLYEEYVPTPPATPENGASGTGANRFGAGQPGLGTASPTGPPSTGAP